MLRVLAIGDVVGRAGRNVISSILPRVKETHNPDIVICNGENAAGGFGLTKKIYTEITEKFQIDAITMGNHWHDKPEIFSFIDSKPNLVVPGNMSNVDELADGLSILRTKTGLRYAIINLIGVAFMKPGNSCPFIAADEILKKIPDSVKVRILDFHAEATSEKQALANYLARRVSLFYGTHTHTPTADERIIDGYTGFATDLGMSGAYDSVIGIRKEASIARFLNKKASKFEPAKNDPWFCGVVADIDPADGRCISIERIRLKLNDSKLSDS